MDSDPQRLIARLAVAVMVADGRITASECAALEDLNDLGLGLLSDSSAAETGGAAAGTRERVTVTHHPAEQVRGLASASDADVEHAYRVLGIDATTSRAHLDAAYLGLIERYNPARVADLGAEFAALAARKLAEVTAAFETVLGARAETG